MAGVTTRIRVLFLVLTVVVGLMGCDREAEEAVGSRLTVWAHSGQPAERRVLQEQVERFNARHPDLTVELTLVPEGDYNAQVQAAALAGELPDILEFDGPFLYNYVWQGHLQPVDSLITEAVRRDLLPSIVAQGSFRGRLYGVGTFDSGLGLFTRKSLLEQVGMPLPDSPRSAWSVAQFNELLARLAAQDDDGAVLDLKLNYRGEWYTYAFAPVLYSAGAGLLRTPDFDRATGVLDSDAAVRALSIVQEWITSGKVDTNLDDNAFVSGRVALSWAGHWEFNRYRQAFGDDLVVVPLPDFGQGSRSGQGSWQWGVNRQARNREAVEAFLAFLLRPEEILAMTTANGAVPARHAAVARSVLYRRGGPLQLFAEQLQSSAVARPQTPAYPVVTSAFQRAFNDIRSGGDVQAILKRAAKTIDRDIQDNRGYR